jgi:hypothetical protein
MATVFVLHDGAQDASLQIAPFSALALSRQAAAHVIGPVPSFEDLVVGADRRLLHAAGRAGSLVLPVWLFLDYGQVGFCATLPVYRAARRRANGDGDCGPVLAVGSLGPVHEKSGWKAAAGLPPARFLGS